MKNRIKIFLIALMAVSVTSCEDFLDRQPLSELSADQFWSSATDAELWMLGMYDAAQLTFDDNMYLWGEVRSDNSEQSGTGTTQELFLANNLNASMDVCSWSNLYRTISLANYGLKYIPNIDDTDTVIQGYLAECLTMRALLYFYAIRVWGDVPLILEAYEGLDGQEMYYDRTPVVDVMAQIKEDVELAISYFGETIIVDRLCLGAAYALQADVAMWNVQQEVTEMTEVEKIYEYTTVIDNYDKLVALGYSLATSMSWGPGGDWKETFEAPATASEAIWFIAWDVTLDGECGWADLLSNSNSNPTYKCYIDLWTKLVNRMDPDDPQGGVKDNRLYFMADMVQSSCYYDASGNYLRPANTSVFGDDDTGTAETFYNYYSLDMGFAKFCVWDDTRENVYNSTTYDLGGYDQPNTGTYQPWIAMYRLSDFYLLKAEALNKLGRYEEACEIVNKIRMRAGYATYSAETGTYYQGVSADNAEDVANLEDIILEERQIELYGEGKRWFDLRRTNKVAEYVDPIIKDVRGAITGFGDQPGYLLFPIADEVFEANPKITQNYPYTQS